jgi:hypothetical protein
MKILFFGDVVGQPGRQAIKESLPQWQKKYQPDFVIANGDNLAHGKGITEKSLKELLEVGVDLVTSGDHIWSKKEAITLLENKEIPLIRPANFSDELPGQGYWLSQIRTKKILVINLIGRVFMKQQYDNPFKKADQILEQEAEGVDAIIVDWHAEATAEKVCLGWYLDGRVSAVLGTHTHIPTADAQILPQGTAYISDVGMVGPKDSSLGADKDSTLESFLKQMPFRYQIADGPVEVDAVLVEIGKGGKAKKIKQLQEIVAF